jgi:CBS-domain-containing membrane protein
MTATSWDIRSFFTEPILAMILGVCLPIVALLRRAGHHPVWCLFALFPGLNVIAFWIFAFKPWPKDTKSVNISY